MSKQTDCARFVLLQDRRLADVAPLSDADLEFLADHGKRCAACGLERAGLQALRRVGDQGEAELSDEEVARGVEHVLGRAQERDPKGRPWFRPLLRPLPVGLAAVGAAAVVAVLMLVGPGDAMDLGFDPTTAAQAEARLTLVVGGVEVDGRPVTALSRLSAGQRVRVAPGGRAVLSFGDGTAALLSHGTDVTLMRSEDGATRFFLKEGAATFRVAPRSEHRRVEVRASWGRVQVVGTVFRVSDRADSRRVQVSRGRVRVQLRRGAPVLLKAGQQLDASGTRGQLDARSWRRLRAAVKLVKQLPARGGGVLVVHAEAPRVRIAVDSILVGRAPVALVLQPGLRKVAAVREGVALDVREVALSSGERAEVRFDLRAKGVGAAVIQPPAEPAPPVVVPSTKPGVVASRRPVIASTPGASAPPPVSPPAGMGAVAAPATPPVVAVETVGQLLSQAARLRAQRSWSAVVKVYRRIIQLHPQAPEAATCLVLMGQVQLRQLRQGRAALGSFARYLRLARRGALAPEAAWGRIEALRLLGRRAAERQACVDLLQRYPRSIYAARVTSRLKGLSAKKMSPK